MGLRAAQQFLEPRGISQPLLQGFRALNCVLQVCAAFHPGVLLLGTQKLAQALGA